MSKFVTYGATETLDNDQKFIIDSDRTGPGSITAKDAASSLLSKWAGFETFEEAVQNTISNNQEFIDRDTAIRSETADLKKKIVTTFPAKDASGAVATFESEFEDAPLKSCIVRVEPVQAGSGDPSPDNVRPISGWTGCEIVRANTNLWNDDWYALGNIMSLITDETDDFYGYYNGYVKRWDNAQRENGNEHLFPNGVDRLTVTFEAGCVHTGSSFTFKVFFHYTDGTEDSAGGNAVLDPLEKRTVVRASTIGKKCTGFRISTIAGIGNNWGAVRRIMVSANDERDIIAPVRTAYPITFPTEAGTVYGGYIDVLRGVMTVENVHRVINENDDFGHYGDTGFTFKSTGMKSGLAQSGLCNLAPTVSRLTNKYGVLFGANNSIIYFAQAKSVWGVNTIDGAIQWAIDHGLELVYPLAEPIEIQLDAYTIKTLLGTNNIWSNTGATEVEYLMSDVSWYVEKKLRAFQSVLAGVEDSAVASKNYSANTYLIFNDDIYRVTKTITAGETIEEGVNVTKTTVAEQLMALAQA